MGESAYITEFKEFMASAQYRDLAAMEQEFFGESTRAVVILQATMI